jgi:hypothetical protein
MYTFNDYLHDLQLEEEMENEAIDIQTRMKMKANLRRNKAKIALGRRKAAKKMATKEVITKRAQRQARSQILNKILKGKSKDELSYGARAAAEKRLAKKGPMIQRLAKKLIPQTRKADRNKMKVKDSK